jgi:hypothetical protein
VTLGPAPAAFVLGGEVGWRRPRSDTLGAVAAILLVVALPLRGLFLATGSSMEEGFMLVFPERMLAGDVPNVDFLHLYGPFSLHVLSGWYWLLGADLFTERLFGLLQHLGIIFGLFTLARPWGHRLATLVAVTATLLVLTPIGLSALAWEGGVALALWSVACGVRALHTSGRSRTTAAVVSGLLAGFALGYRPDLAVALGLAHAWLLMKAMTSGDDTQAAGNRTRRLAWLGGLVVGLVPVLVHLVLAGIGPVWRGMFVEPVFDLRPGRALPRPPGWSQIDGALQAVAEGPADAPWWRVPSLSASQQLFTWFWVVIIVAIAVPALAWWRGRRWRTPAHTALMSAALLGLGMLPQALQRPDSTHLAWGSCVSIPLLVLLLADSRWLRERADLRRDATVAAAMLGLFLVVFPFFTLRYYLLQTRVAVGHKAAGFEVSRDDRWFSFGNEPLQRSAQAMIDDLDRLSSPGERLLVGPADLSRTIYSDAIFYHLFPELEPATTFIEMDPGLADDPGSSLADDVASADWLVLTNYWTGWYEPNASSEFGSTEPNEVVARSFCLVGEYEDALVLLYRRCAPGEQPDGRDPSTIGIGAQRRADFMAELASRTTP